jgi:hypothetical protein
LSYLREENGPYLLRKLGTDFMRASVAVVIDRPDFDASGGTPKEIAKANRTLPALGFAKGLSPMRYACNVGRM